MGFLGYRVKLALASVSLLLWSCANPGSYSIELLFPDERARQLTASLRLVLVRPASQANCSDLLAGQAQPGDDGYDIEDQVTFTLPLSEDAPFLEVQAEGRILLFAEGSDSAATVIVNGCSEAQASLGGVHEVTIQLSWTIQPCEADDDCEDGNPCTADSCVQLLCSHEAVPSGTTCDDGNWCSVQDSCDGAGNCSGQPRDCSQLDGQCLRGVCDEEQDSCVAEPDNEGQPCDDGLFCTTGEICQGGTCGGGGETDCDDGIDCTTDSCDQQSDSCLNEPVDAACDDGIPCSTDTCNVLSGCQHTANAGGCPSYHIGPVADGCPHLDEAGLPTSVCDYTGDSGLEQAVADAPAEGASFFLYDDDGQPFWFHACTLDIPGSSLVAAATGVERRNVILSCPPTSTGQNGILHLDGDDIHIKDVTFVNLSGSNAAISTWPLLSQQDGASEGHLIENVIGMALQPEVVGYNSIEEPLRLGSHTTVRNSHFFGFYENSFRLAGLQDVRLVGNTLVYFQKAGSPITVEDSSGVVLANNLVLSLTNQLDALVTGSGQTTGLVVSGNVVEGFAELVTGLDPDDNSNLVQDNSLGPAEVESPLVPLFLADSTQLTSPLVAGEGSSLDGQLLEGRTGLLPGAYQQRSQLSGPRRMIIRLGDDNCGVNPCDFTPADDNELQLAVFSSWPGGTIEIYPYIDYAGDAIVPWGLDIIGQGGSASQVVLTSREEDPLWSQAEMWQRHAALLVVLRRQELPTRLENMTLLVSSDAQADDRAVMIEGSQDTAPSAGWHQLRHLVVGSLPLGTAGLKQALYLGDHVLLTDSLIAGAFNTCIRFGVRSHDRNATPPTSDRVVNVTCRLNGSGSYAPDSLLDVASVVDAYFVNLAMEAETPAAFLRAQRRSSGDTGVTALDAPTSYTLHSATVRGTDTNTDGYEPGDGNYTVTAVEHLGSGDPFFVAPDDSHLDVGCSAIDSGVDPASISNGAMQAGVSLDGVDRTAVSAIDRGCYEQGQ